jgi:hypothetical protein
MTGKITPHPHFGKRSCEEFRAYPLTVPSPARGEGNHIEIIKKFPSPLTGEGEGGGDLGDYFTASGGWGKFESYFVPSFDI